MAGRRLLCDFAKKHNLVSLSNHARHELCFSRHKKESRLSLSPVSRHKFDFSSEVPNKCWNCDYAFKSQLFCSKCKVLQEQPENLTYFEIIGIPRTYDVSIDEIRKKYMDLQKQLHPDKFGSKSEKEKGISEGLSTLVNKAYGTLTNPLSRGLYLLKLAGISIPEGTTNLNPKLLMVIMEQNEEIEDAEGDRDKILKLVDQNRNTLNTLSKKLANAFNTGNTDKAREIIIEMKYYSSIDNRLKKLKHDLGIVE